MGRSSCWPKSLVMIRTNNYWDPWSFKVVGLTFVLVSGLFLIAAETATGRWSIVGPLLLTWLLLKFSGVALTERRVLRSRPGYEAYIKRTSAFIPWPPQSGNE